jgi:hypothetical protein
MEPGMPFTLDASAVQCRLQAQLLSRAMKGFPTVTVVVTGDLGVAPVTLEPLWAQVDEVIAPSEAEAAVLPQRLGCPSSLVRVDARSPDRTSSGRDYGGDKDPIQAETGIRTRAAHLRQSSESTALVTPLGPLEWDERPRWWANLAFRKVLGRHADPLRGRVARLYHLARR